MAELYIYLAHEALCLVQAFGEGVTVMDNATVNVALQELRMVRVSVRMALKGPRIVATGTSGRTSRSFGD
jgi:hypothetical protein